MPRSSPGVPGCSRALRVAERWAEGPPLTNPARPARWPARVLVIDPSPGEKAGWTGDMHFSACPPPLEAAGDTYRRRYMSPVRGAPSPVFPAKAGIHLSARGPVDPGLRRESGPGRRKRDSGDIYSEDKAGHSAPFRDIAGRVPAASIPLPWNRRIMLRCRPSRSSPRALPPLPRKGWLRPAALPTAAGATAATRGPPAWPPVYAQARTRRPARFSITRDTGDRPRPSPTRVNAP